MSFIGKVTNFLDFGAVKINPFPKPVPCTTNQIFCQPTNQFDQIAFQFEASESTELVTNGDFDDAISVGWTFTGWTRVQNGLIFSGIHTASVNALSQKGILIVNDYYRVTITVTNFPGGALIVGGGSGSTINNIALAIRGNGTFQAYFQYNEAGGAGDFIIQGSETAVSVRVDDISVIKISDTTDYDIEIINQETGVVIDTVPAANVRIIENLLTIDFNWTDDVTVTNGCRQIQIIDNTNLFEDTFSTNQGWAVSSDITFPGTQMLFISTGVDGNAQIDNIFVVGETYEFTFTTASMVGGSVFIQCGRTVGTTRTTNGTFVQELTCTDTGRLSLRFSGGGGATAAADTLTIKKVNNIAARSECYDLQDTHDCTLLFEWSNDEKWGGYDYSTPPSAGDPIPPFVQRLRVEAKFRGTKYPSVRNIGEDSGGVKAMDYTSLRKVKILDIHRAPDYIHDAIAAFFMQDTRTIEDISYIMEDEYEPSAPNDSVILFKDLMTSRSELEETIQSKLINRNI